MKGQIVFSKGTMHVQGWNGTSPFHSGGGGGGMLSIWKSISLVIFQVARITCLNLDLPMVLIFNFIGHIFPKVNKAGVQSEKIRVRKMDKCCMGRYRK